MKRRLTILTLCGLSLGTLVANVHAQVPIEEASNRGVTGIAPGYFGPNAFPVPEMESGLVESQLRVELAVDGYKGYEGDKTADVFARLTVPLFSRWANLCVWMPVTEWYEMTLQRQQTCRLQDTAVIRGHGAGDVYLATNIQLMSGAFPCFEGRTNAYWYPDISLRVGVKTASGGQFGLARHYDAPGYWFDGAIGENLLPADAPVALRLSATAGFLCWQTNVGRQNDAVQYGLQLAVTHPHVSASVDWRGYTGWEVYGDRPMVVRLHVAGDVRGFSPYIDYQYGIRDYPFHMLRVGLAYHIDVLHKHH